MKFYKKEAKVMLSPVKVSKDLKDSIIGVSAQLEKNYTDTMIELLELGVKAHLDMNVAKQKVAKPKKAAVKKFVAPTVDEVFSHMFTTNGSTKIAQDEAQKFVNYWSDMDWKRKGTKMASWKGSASNWLKNNYGAKSAVNQSGFLNDDSQIIDGHVVAPSQAGFLNHET